MGPRRAPKLWFWSSGRRFGSTPTCLRSSASCRRRTACSASSSVNAPALHLRPGATLGRQGPGSSVVVGSANSRRRARSIRRPFLKARQAATSGSSRLRLDQADPAPGVDGAAPSAVASTRADARHRAAAPAACVGGLRQHSSATAELGTPDCHVAALFSRRWSEATGAASTSSRRSAMRHDGQAPLPPWLPPPPVSTRHLETSGNG